MMTILNHSAVAQKVSNFGRKAKVSFHSVVNIVNIEKAYKISKHYISGPGGGRFSSFDFHHKAYLGEVALTSIFMAIMTTSGSPSVTVSPGFTDTFSMTPGMGATAPLPPPPPIFCVTNFGVRSFSSLLPSCNARQIGSCL